MRNQRSHSPQIYRHRFRGDNLSQVRETIKVIGSAIKRNAEDLDIRNHAAALATTAAPKDYLGQLRAVYKDFVKRWRYVKDPAHKELVTASPEAVKRYILALDGIGLGRGRGGGDCDCVTVAIGGELLSIGFPVRIATTADPGARPGNLFGHVFAQAMVPNVGWVTVDPVLFPTQKPLSIARHSRIAFWDLQGNLLGYNGNVRGLSGSDFTEGKTMYGQTMDNLNDWNDLSGYLGFGASESPREPEPWESVGLADWGYLAGQMGIISGDEIEQVPVEVIPDRDGLARTPMLELSPEDFKHMKVWKQPYEGMLALGDDGTPYQYTSYEGADEEPYDGMLGRRRRRRGFFKRLFRRVAKGIRKVAKKIKKGIRKVISKIPGGKFILKIADKIHKVAMKIVKPLMKFVGKYASKLAPFAAMIPGFGPAIAAGLHVAGKVAQVYNKFSKVVKIVGKVGQARTLVAKDPSALKAMQAELAAAALKLQMQRAIAAKRR